MKDSKLRNEVLVEVTFVADTVSLKLRYKIWVNMGKFENEEKKKALKKMRASHLFLLNLALYARRDSNPEPWA